MIELIQSQNLALHGAVSSMTGGRRENQDDFAWADTPLGFLLVVCDGMGGGPGGSTASYLAKTSFVEAVVESAEQASPLEAIKRAVSLANDALFQRMEEVPELRGMGSTLVAILISAQSAVVAHVGDSRCYRLHGDRVKMRTQDHSLVGELVRNKALTEEQARTSPQSNVITRGLGSTTNHVADIVEVPFHRGDRFVLCTDGVWGIMPHPELIQKIGAPVEVSTLVQNLQEEIDRIGLASGGGHDNHTLAIIDMDFNSLMQDGLSTTTKIVFGILGLCLCLSLGGNLLFLSKLGKMPKNSDLELLMRENTALRTQVEEYKYKFSVFEEIRETSQESIESQLLDLKMKQKQLLDSIQALNDSIQNLRKTGIDSHKSTDGGRNSSSTSSKSSTTSGSAAPDGVIADTNLSPQKLISLIQDKYGLLEKTGTKIKIPITKKEEQKAIAATTQKVIKLRNQIKGLLKQLGTHSDDLKTTTEAIVRILPEDEDIARFIAPFPSDQEYRLTDPFLHDKHQPKGFAKSKEKVDELASRKELKTN